MDTVMRIIGAHPTAPHTDTPIPNLIMELKNCETTCNVCADACLSDQDVQMLVECIALNTLCADVCSTTARLAARVGHHQKSVMQHQLQACREACRLCAAECERHEHEHCKVCAESCRSCEQACNKVLERAMAMT